MTMKSKMANLLSGLFLVSASAVAMAADVGETALITQSTGTVQVTLEGGKREPAVSFAKLKSGTKVTIANESRFQVVYLSSGRQENWVGATELEIGDDASKPIKTSKLPAVKQLSPMILKGLIQAPVMIADMRSKQGMIRVRAAGDWAKLDDAEKTYKLLRAQAGTDDVTPELFLLATYSEMKLYDKMKQPLEDMLVRQPGNEDIRALLDSYTNQMASKNGEK